MPQYFLYSHWNPREIRGTQISFKVQLYLCNCCKYCCFLVQTSSLQWTRKFVKFNFSTSPFPSPSSIFPQQHKASTFFWFSIRLIFTHHTIVLCLLHRRCCSLKCIYSRPCRIFGVFGWLKSLCRRTWSFLFLSSDSDHLKLSFRLMGVAGKNEKKTTNMRVNKSNFISWKTLGLSAFY